MDEYEIIINELDDFVEADLSFDSLTEFIVDVAIAIRSNPEIEVNGAIRSVMTAYRRASEGQNACDAVPLAADDHVRDTMHRGEAH